MAAIAVVLGACDDRPASDARSVQVVRAGDSTYVAISEPSNVRQSEQCMRYCDRLAECWYAVSTGTQPLTRDEVRTRCRSEQEDCRIRTKANHCCGALTDCLEFAECHSKSSAEPAECKVQGKP